VIRIPLPQTLRQGSFTFPALLAVLAASSISFLPTPAQAATTSPAPPGVRAHSTFHPERFSKRALLYYRLVWGVDSLSVKYAESGEMIRFAYRVVDPAKAKILNDRNIEPSLIDQQAGVRLVVPALEKVGKLRQINTPQAGRSYWMAFSNKGRLVKPGHRVTVIVGHFRADGLAVE
jgi:hypothetical protein